MDPYNNPGGRYLSTFHLPKETKYQLSLGSNNATVKPFGRCDAGQAEAAPCPRVWAGGSQGGFSPSGRLGSCNTIQNLSTNEVHEDLEEFYNLIFYFVSFVPFVVIFSLAITCFLSVRTFSNEWLSFRSRPRRPQILLRGERVGSARAPERRGSVRPRPEE